MTIPGVALTGVQKKTITDRVQLPRLYLAWLTPRHFEPGDAALDMVADVLAGGKNSRLYKRLVYDMQIAQDVSAFQASQALSSSFQIVATPRPGPHGRGAAEGDRRGDRRSCSARRRRRTSCERSVNQIEASFYNRMERVGGFGGKADQLNAYFTDTGDPDWFNEDLARYRALSAGRHQRRRGAVPAARPARRADRRAGEANASQTDEGRESSMRDYVAALRAFARASCCRRSSRSRRPTASQPPQPGPPPR